ncbi:MAG: hypothetical protein JRJ83_10280 [Deltaproteobacteria bacterium]|nr:hypothetical protein [Deltaproteobacteria bacterium]
MLHHLPPLLRDAPPGFRARIKGLPSKIVCAILAVEIAAAIVYRGGWEEALEGRLRTFIRTGHFDV